MPLTLLKPTLYALIDARPVLLGGRCECGFKFFPMQKYGCERCGRNGDSLSSMQLRGTGTLIASTVVNVHADAQRKTPFVVGAVALDDGPVVRTLLIDVRGNETRPARVEAVLVPVATGTDAEAFDLRFKLSGAT